MMNLINIEEPNKPETTDEKCLGIDSRYNKLGFVPLKM